MDKNKEELLKLWENREVIRIADEDYALLKDAIENRQARFNEALAEAIKRYDGALRRLADS